MADSQEPKEPDKLTISEVEEIVNEFAQKYAHEHYSLPETAFRIFLWPYTAEENLTVKITAGPTARIMILGRAGPAHPNFNRMMRDAIDRVAALHMYSSMAIEKVAHILERTENAKRWFREKYNFDPDLIPKMLHDEEIVVRFVERVEVIHKATGLREVVEVEPGKRRGTFATRDIAKMRLARRVHELNLELVRAQKGDNEIPFPQTA